MNNTIKTKWSLSFLLILVMMLAMVPSVFANDNSIVITSLEELQEALTNENITEVIITDAITLPDGTVLDGNGKTVRVEKPYIKEDGTCEESPSTTNVFIIESTSNVTIRNMTIMGGEKSGTAAVSSNGHLTMENVSVVRSNRGLDDYGGVTVLKNCNLSHNVCKSAGSIWCGNGAKLILDGCSITNNHSSGSSANGGGAITVNGSNTYLYANNTIFANNATKEIGGAINIYDGNVYLMNCTVTGNCTNSIADYGGGIGQNGGKFYAVNSIFVDNYANVTIEMERSDIGIYRGRTATINNCVYSRIKGSMTSITDCIIDDSNQTAYEYTNDGIMLYTGAISDSFTHPNFSSGDNNYSNYIPLKSDGNAVTGGVSTYFDYSDTSNVKMGFGDDDDITSLGGLEVPTSNNKVIKYYEEDSREDGIIGASNFVLEPISTWEQLATKLANGGTVKLTQDITSPSDGGELTIPRDVTTTLDLNGYIINRNSYGDSVYGNVIRVSGGNLTIEDSKPDRVHTPSVSYNEPISGDSVVISGGIITGGYRGIFLESGGTVTMNAGTIAGNYLNDEYSAGGAGVHLLGGSTFNMNGGSIENNIAPFSNGGAVFVYYGSTFYLNGGIVRNNTCAGEGGGFFLYDNQSSRAKLYLTGGTITGNKSVGGGGAVCVNSNGGVLFVSGNPVVQRNYKDNVESNIKGPGDTFVNIVGPMTEGAHVGVTTSSAPTLEYSPVFTNDYKTYNEGIDPENYFFSDYGENILAGFANTGEAAFMYPVTTWEELRTSFGHYGGIKLTCDIKASASDQTIGLGWCETCLDLNGHIIDCSAMTTSANAFATTSKYAVLTIIDSNPTATHTPALSYIDPISEEEIVVNGGIITGRPDGVFTGTEIYCQLGAVVLKGGTILGKSTPGGSAVYLLYESANFHMDGGTICGNNSSTDGGAITNIEGKVYLNGGKITGNIANNNGGGIINGYGKLFITGGEITNNVSNGDGAGVYQNDHSNSNISISVKPVITGNKKSEEENNIYLLNKTITISDELEDGASIGVTTSEVPTYSSLLTFTTGFNTYNSDDDPSDYFISDKGYDVITSTGEAAFKGEISTWAELQSALRAGGTVTLTQDIYATESDRSLNIDSNISSYDISLDLNGHIIDFSAATAKESVIMVWYSKATFTIKDSNPTATHNPAFTYINPVTNEEVVVNGGIITGGDSNGLYVGGGLSCKSGICNFEGGSIAGNISTSDGGAGVCADNGIFNMTGGSICGNISTGADAYGGGIKVQSTGTFNMSGGSITGNSTVSTGGGIWSWGNFTITGGSITYNKSDEDGGGISQECKMSGNPVIMNNMKGDIIDNVHCNITIVGELTDGASVGVTTAAPSLGTSRPFTTGYSTYNSGDDPASYFVSDIEGAVVNLNEDGEAQLSVLPSRTVILGQIRYELRDTYGDGWNGCEIRIIDTSGDNVVETLTMSNGRELSGFTENLLPGHIYNLYWNHGGYPGEANFNLYHESGDVLFEGYGNVNLTGSGIFLTVQVDYTVTVSSDENGTASANPTSGHTGTEVTLTATPIDETFYKFKEWQVISGDVTITDDKFTIGTSNVEIKAVFEELSEPMLGDLDDDKIITIIDVRLLLQEFISSTPTTKWTDDDLAVMDMDKNKTINIIDVRLLLQEFIGE